MIGIIIALLSAILKEKINKTNLIGTLLALIGAFGIIVIG